MDQQRPPHFGFNTSGNVIKFPARGRNITVIAAMDNQAGIGKNNGIPWAISPDMQQFKRLTTGHPVIMGRKTFETLKKPLSDRLNIVLTHDVGYVEKYHDMPNVRVKHSLDEALQEIAELREWQLSFNHPNVEEINKLNQVFIIGGGEIYRQALAKDLVDDMIITRLSHNALCDTFFPALQAGMWVPPAYSTHALSGGVSMRYEYWRRKKKE